VCSNQGAPDPQEHQDAPYREEHVVRQPSAKSNRYNLKRKQGFCVECGNPAAVTQVQLLSPHKKRTRSLKRRAKSALPEVTGKIVDSVELKPSDTGYSIGLMFTDRTFLSFDIEPHIGFTIEPELSNWKSGNYRPMKRWRSLVSE